MQHLFCALFCISVIVIYLYFFHLNISNLCDLSSYEASECFTWTPLWPMNAIAQWRYLYLLLHFLFGKDSVFIDLLEKKTCVHKTAKAAFISWQVRIRFSPRQCTVAQNRRSKPNYCDELSRHWSFNAPSCWHSRWTHLSGPHRGEAQNDNVRWHPVFKIRCQPSAFTNFIITK